MANKMYCHGWMGVFALGLQANMFAFN